MRMDIQNNEAILVTTWSHEVLQAVLDWAHRLGGDYSQLIVCVPTLVSGRTTVVFAPDGSYKGRDTAQIVARLREEFVQLLQAFDDADEANSFDWVEVSYGDYGQTVLRGNCYGPWREREIGDEDNEPI